MKLGDGLILLGIAGMIAVSLAAGEQTATAIVSGLVGGAGIVWKLNHEPR